MPGVGFDMSDASRDDKRESYVSRVTQKSAASTLFRLSVLPPGTEGPENSGADAETYLVSSVSPRRANASTRIGGCMQTASWKRPPRFSHAKSLITSGTG